MSYEFGWDPLGQHSINIDEGNEYEVAYGYRPVACMCVRAQRAVSPHCLMRFVDFHRDRASTLHSSVAATKQ